MERVHFKLMLVINMLSMKCELWGDLFYDKLTRAELGVEMSRPPYVVN